MLAVNGLASTTTPKYVASWKKNQPQQPQPQLQPEEQEEEEEEEEELTTNRTEGHDQTVTTTTTIASQASQCPPPFHWITKPQQKSPVL